MFVSAAIFASFDRAHVVAIHHGVNPVHGRNSASTFPEQFPLKNENDAFWKLPNPSGFCNDLHIASHGPLLQ